MKLQKGMRFKSKSWLDTKLYDGKTKQTMQITRIASGMVYYAPVYVYDGAEGESREGLGGRWKVEIGKMDSVVGEWL